MKKGAGIALLLGAGALILSQRSNATPPVYVPPVTGGGGNTGGNYSQVEITAKRATLIAWAYAKWDATSATEFVKWLALLTNSETALVFNYAILKLRDGTTIAGMQSLASRYDLTGLYP